MSGKGLGLGKPADLDSGKLRECIELYLKKLAMAIKFTAVQQTTTPFPLKSLSSGRAFFVISLAVMLGPPGQSCAKS